MENTFNGIPFAIPWMDVHSSSDKCEKLFQSTPAKY